MGLFNQLKVIKCFSETGSAHGILFIILTLHVNTFYCRSDGLLIVCKGFCMSVYVLVSATPDKTQMTSKSHVLFALFAFIMS